MARAQRAKGQYRHQGLPGDVNEKRNGPSPPAGSTYSSTALTFITVTDVYACWCCRKSASQRTLSLAFCWATLECDQKTVPEIDESIDGAGSQAYAVGGVITLHHFPSPIQAPTPPSPHLLLFRMSGKFKSHPTPNLTPELLFLLNENVLSPSRHPSMNTLHAPPPPETVADVKPRCQRGWLESWRSPEHPDARPAVDGT